MKPETQIVQVIYLVFIVALTLTCGVLIATVRDLKQEVRKNYLLHEDLAHFVHTRFVYLPIEADLGLTFEDEGGD